MASAEMQLVSKIIKTGDLKSVIEWGLTPDDFLMTEMRAIFQQILVTYTSPESSGSVIGPRLAQEKFTQLNLSDVDEFVTIPHLCQELRNRRLSNLIRDGIHRASESIGDPIAATGHLQDIIGQVMRLDGGRNTDINFGVGMERLMERYLKIKAGETLGRFPWPWAPLQEETGGLAEDDYIVFYGRPKSMKTWVLCYNIAWAVQQEQRVLVYTKEMTGDNIYMRLGACLAGVPYSDVRKATLTPEQERLLWDWVDRAYDLGPDRLVVLSAKDAAGRDTVAWLQSKIDRYAPTVCFVDGLYLMSPDNPRITEDHKRVMNISRGIRQMILDTKVPVVATMQANRKAAGHSRAELDEIAFSDSISQDCTMAARVINDKNEQTISLVLGGSREFHLEGFRIYGIPATNFSFHSKLSAGEIAQAKTGDSEEEPEKKKRSPRTLKPRGSDSDFTENYNAAYKVL